jgi:hypothetical protein
MPTGNSGFFPFLVDAIVVQWLWLIVLFPVSQSGTSLGEQIVSQI